MSDMDSKKKDFIEELANIGDLVEGKTQIIPVIAGEDDDILSSVTLPSVLPILTLRSSVLFPGAITPITVGREKSMKLVRDVESSGAILGAVLQKDAKVENPGPEDLYRIGTAARILKILEMPNGNLTVILHGLEKFEVVGYIASEPFYKANVTQLKDISPEENI